MNEFEAKRILRQVSRTLDTPYLRKVKRVVVGVVGGTVLCIGLALLVLPGPAVVVIPLGLAILATEFVWARRWLRKARALLPANQPNKKRQGNKDQGAASGA